jgi:RNA polymerase sigma-70 factor (ECF subfamily)
LIDAEDAVQDTLVKILCLDIFIEPDKLRAFMYRTSIRTYINSYNRSKHYQKIIKNLEKELETAAFLVESSPLPKIIEQLSPYYNRLLTAYYYENSSTKQLAEYFECSLSKIKIDLYRARKSLKNNLKKLVMTSGSSNRLLKGIKNAYSLNFPLSCFSSHFIFRTDSSVYFCD